MDFTRNSSEEQATKINGSEENSARVSDTIHETRRTRKEPIFGEERLLVLCDGIFAIATTLLVLDIRLPSGMNNEADFNTALSLLFSNEILFYLITFYVIGSFWMLHRRVMQHVKYLDGRFISLTLLFLVFITFFPVSSSIIRQYGYRGAVLLYTLTFAGCGFSLLGIWLYASWHHRLIDPALPRDQIAALSTQIAVTPTYFSLSLLLLPFFLEHPTRIFWSWTVLPVLVYFSHLIYHKLFPSSPYRRRQTQSENPHN